MFWQRQINSAALRLSQSASPCSMLNMSNICTQTLSFNVHTHLTTQLNFLHCCTSDTSRPSDAPLIKLSCHFGTHFYPLNLYTCPSPCMREPGLHMPLWPSPPIPYFGMPVPGICSNSSHPVGIGMSPPLPLSSLLPVSVYLMYVLTCMKQPTWSPLHVHEPYSIHILLGSPNLITTKLINPLKLANHSCRIDNCQAKNNSADNMQL